MKAPSRSGFKVVTPNLFVHPDGYEVEVTDLFRLEYREAGGRLAVGTELLNGPALLVAFLAEAKWDDGRPATSVEMDRIGPRLRDAFAAIGHPIELD